MKRIISTSTIALALAFGACTQQEASGERIVRQPADGTITEDDFYDEEGNLNVNLTVQDFIDEFRGSNAQAQRDLCALYNSVETDEDIEFFYNTMSDAGYSGDQIVNMFEALGTVC